MQENLVLCFLSCEIKILFYKAVGEAGWEGVFVLCKAFGNYVLYGSLLRLLFLS